MTLQSRGVTAVTLPTLRQAIRISSDTAVWEHSTAS